MADTDIPIPESLKAIRPYMLLAKQHDKKDTLISYFCMRYAMETAMRQVQRAPEDKKFLFLLMDALEKRKKALSDSEAFQNDMVCNSYVENYAIKIFSYCDNEDRAGRFTQNLAKTFYRAGLLLDVLQTFGELSEELQMQKKYAKYKAANISGCLKKGETPTPGPPGGEDEDESFLGMPPAGAMGAPGPSIPPAHPQPFPPGQPPSAMYPPQNPYPPQQPPNMPPPGHVPNAATPTNHAQPGAFAPPSTPDQQPQAQPRRGGSIQFSTEDFAQATKYCKYTISSLQYEDVPAAITNLEKALRLLKTGKDG